MHSNSEVNDCCRISRKRRATCVTSITGTTNSRCTALKEIYNHRSFTIFRQSFECLVKQLGRFLPCSNWSYTGEYLSDSQSYGVHIYALLVLWSPKKLTWKKHLAVWKKHLGVFWQKKSQIFRQIRFMLCFWCLRIVYLKMDWVLVINIEISRAYYRIDMSYLFIIL